MRRSAVVVMTAVLGLCHCAKVLGFDELVPIRQQADAGSLRDGSSLSPTIDEACDALAEAYCGLFDRCFAETKRFQASDADCVARRKGACVTELSYVDTGETPERVLACARDRTTFPCEDVYAYRAPDSCAPVPGGRSDGADCWGSVQCKNKLCVVGAGTSGCGACAKLPEKGDACDPTHPCARDLLCVDGRCGDVAPERGACTGDFMCRQDLTCISGQCAPRIAPGGPCGGGKGECLLGYGCNAKTSRCTELVGVARGAHCGEVATGDEGRCLDGDRCISLSESGPVCVGVASPQEACSDEVHCAPPAACSSGVCVLPPPTICP